MRVGFWGALGVVLVLSGYAWADIAPHPGPKPYPGPGRRAVPPPVVVVVPPQQKPVEQETKHADVVPPLDRDTKIQMEQATVEVLLSQASPDAEGRNSRDEYVQADVTARFTLNCVATKFSPVTFPMTFPTSLETERSVKCTKFSVQLDDKAPKWTKEDRWLASDSGVGRSYYHGYVWPATMTREGSCDVTVTYRLLLTVQRNTASFGYILRTGGTWSGPIGRETVHVAAAKGLSIRTVDSTELKLLRKGNNELTWELKDIKPTQDIRVSIMLSPTAK